MKEDTPVLVHHFKHKIDFDNVKVLHKETNLKRKKLE